MSDTSTSTKKAGPVRSCPNCRIRMSSIDFDSHTICSSCRGKSCNLNDRCDMCVSWSDDKMNAYMKHQASLERKRVAKKRARESRDNDPFLSACTGVGGNDLVLSEEVIASGMNDELTSSVATSATKQQVEQLVVTSVSELGSTLRSEINSDINYRFNALSTSFLEVLNRRFDHYESVTNNNSIPAPHPHRPNRSLPRISRICPD